MFIIQPREEHVVVHHTDIFLRNRLARNNPHRSSDPIFAEVEFCRLSNSNQQVKFLIC